MRRLFLAWLCLVLLGGAACTRQSAGPGGSATPPATELSADDRLAIHIAALRRYLTSPAENSFGGGFENVYVLEHLARPVAASGSSTAADPVFSAADQRAIVDALRDLAPVRFVADRTEVVVMVEGCGHVPDGILMTLGVPQRSGDRVELGVQGFVGCVGATALTYVLEHAESTWRVTGTAGPIAVA